MSYSSNFVLLFFWVWNCVIFQQFVSASSGTDSNFVCCNCRFSRKVFTLTSHADNLHLHGFCWELNQNQSFSANQTIEYSENNEDNLDLKIAEFIKTGTSTNLWDLERGIQSICCNEVDTNFSREWKRNENCLHDLGQRSGSERYQMWSFCGSNTTAPFDTTLVYLSISLIILLSLTISTYLYLPYLLNIHGKTIVCHLICLMLSYILQTIQYFVEHKVDQKAEERTFYCFLLGIGFYMTSMGALFWLCIINLDIWHTFIRKYAEDSEDVKKRFRKYCIAGFGTPILLTFLVIILEFALADDNVFKPRIRINTNRCFFSTTNGYSIALYYYGVTAIMITANLVIFGQTNIALCKIQAQVASAREASTAVPNDNFARLFLFFKLFCVMGTTWIINILLWSISHDTYSTEEKTWTARFFECFNVMHGFCYFLIFVCKPSILQMLRDKVQNLSRSGDSNVNTTVTRGYDSIPKRSDRR